MSEGTGIVVRRRRSSAEAKRLVFEFEPSGLSRQAFCSQQGLSIVSLDKYRRRFRSLDHRQAHSERAPSRILPVELVNSTASAVDSRTVFRVELSNGRRIEVGTGFDASTLERLLVVLDRG